MRVRLLCPSARQYARCTRRRVFVEQRPAGALCRWCSQCRSAADRAARHRNTIRSSQFRRSSGPLAFRAGIRRSCGLSRAPGSRDAGISVGRSATRNRRPPTSYSLRISLSRLATTSPSGSRPSFSLSAREDSVARGANSTRFALTRPAKSSTCSTVSRASSASLIFRPSPRPLEAPLTAQLRLSEAEADATCEHQRKRAGEAVLVGLNLGAGEHLLRDSISDTICGERMDRFQTRVGFGVEKESKCLQKKTQLGDVRF